MVKHQMTTFMLALKYLRKNSFRTKSLISIVAVFAFAIFCGALLSQSISLGRNYMSGRMGADIMVVPRGCALSLENTLLRSESNTFYLNDNFNKGISSIPGVQQMSPQLYIGSLNASCCTVPVQLIGYEPKTDFTIKSWMTNIDSSKLGFGEVVIGSQVNAAVGSQIWLFGQPVKVAATIDDTGMGFDSSVFMTLETAQHMIATSEKSAVRPAGSGKDQISALFIKLASDSDPFKVAKLIMSEYPQTDVVVLKEMMQHVSTQQNKIRGIIYGIQGLLWMVAILILTFVITMTTNVRKREFGLFLALGATWRKLKSLLMTEILIISVSGAICGVIVACFIMFEFRMLIATSLGIPYIQPTLGSTIILAATSLLISVFTGMIACGHSVIRIRGLEPHIMTREY